MTICIKLETDWAKAAAKAIDESNLPEAKKYSHFSRRESKDLNGAQMGSAVIESMSENLIDFKLSPMMSFALVRGNRCNCVSGNQHVGWHGWLQD